MNIFIPEHISGTRPGDKTLCISVVDMLDNYMSLEEKTFGYFIIYYSTHLNHRCMLYDYTRCKISVTRYKQNMLHITLVILVSIQQWTIDLKDKNMPFNFAYSILIYDDIYIHIR